MADDWRIHPAQALQLFSAAWPAGGPDWAAHEERDDIRYNERQLARETALRMGPEHFQPLIDAYGAALTCRFLLGALVVFDLSQGASAAAVASFHAAIAGSVTVELNFNLNKTVLAQQWFGRLHSSAAPPAQWFLYFDSQKALGFLAGSTLKQLEDHLWCGDLERPVLFLLPESDVSYTGPFLSVLGGRYLFAGEAESGVHAPFPLPFGAAKATLQKSSGAGGGVELGSIPLSGVMKRCREVLKWQESFVEQLTPWHLAGEVDAECARHPLVSALHVHLANAFLLFSADRSARRHGPTRESLISTYTSTQQSLDVALALPETYAGPAFSGEQAGALVELLDWVYDPHWSAADRLALVQIVVVEALRGAPEGRSFDLLLENISTILENVRFHWKGFVEGKIDAYTAQVQEMENAVSAAIQNYAGQMAALVKSLSDTMLAAVGVLIGTFIAALFEKNFTALIFQIGMFGYSAYVFCFPLLYNMLFQWGSFRLLQQDFAARKRRFYERLPHDTVDLYLSEGRVPQAQRYFWLWFGVTLVIYLLVIGLGLWTAFNVPALLAKIP